MRRRARRVTIAAAALGVAVVGVLFVVNWGAVRDHVEAWHFQLTSETETIQPQAANRSYPEPWSIRYVSAFLAHYSGQPVILAADSSHSDRLKLRPGKVTGELTMQKILQANGYRVLEQRFPRRAYVVIRDKLASRSFYESVEIGVGVGSLRSACPGVDNGPMQEAAAASYKEPGMRAISLPTPPEVPSRP